MRMIFVNLPVKDLAASRAFFAALGFEFNREFSDDTAACMVVDQNIYVMLLADVADAEVLIGLSAQGREQVDELVSKAVAAGGRPWKPAMANGPMYGGSFQDLDGHVWELLHLGPS